MQVKVVAIIAALIMLLSALPAENITLASESLPNLL